ncbi:MAG: diguanylate cyclase [Rhodoferax sp.]|nr:diguanylate cyclase [Rhodoferax sp.]MCF8211229.1 diguanylate cyclase [Rhodoferax sp.]
MTMPRPRILTIDDTPANLQMLIAALAVDFDIQIATSGALGLTYAQQTRPDLILLDVMMSEMDGYEVCRRLKADHQLRDIPVIFLTALGDAQSESAGLALGAADYIAKPVNVATAQQRIRNLLEREAMRQTIQTQFSELKQATDLLQTARQRELEFGNAIQHTLLQGVIPKGIEGASVSNFSQPSQVVDGDFSDIRRLHTNSFDILVGDVMGKGVGAALIGAGVRSAYHQVLADLQVVKSFGTVLPTPAQIVNELHRVLTSRLVELSSFVTLALYRFDLESGTLTYVNAGHTHALLLCAAQGKVVPIAGENLPIGVLPDEVYAEVCVPIGQGDSLLIYSDGITEACNPGGEQFGQERLIGAFEAGRAAALVPFALLDSLQQTIKVFTGGAPALDDQTAIVVEWPSDVHPLTRAESVAEPRSLTMHRRAEAVARNFLTEASRNDRYLSAAEAQQVMYELRVHQIELEMQAEELHRTRIELDVDMVERKKLEDVLRESELRYRTVADFTSDWEYWILTDGSLRYVSPSCEQISGYTPTEFYAEPDLLSRIVYADDQVLYAKHRHDLSLPGGREVLDFRIMTKGGDIRWIAHVCQPVFDGEGKPTGVRASNRDNTDRKLMEEQVRQLAFYDPLTHLANRRLLNDRLSQTLLTSKRSAFYGALMFLDLDNFKPLNDHHGHSVGDLLLVEVATRLKACVREIDTVARFGGDEFVVLLDELALSHADSLSQAAVIAEKIRLALAAPYVLGLEQEGVDKGTLNHRCTASIGVTLLLHGEANQDDVLVRADAAMYQAKERGRNRVQFYENRAVAPVQIA